MMLVLEQFTVNSPQSPSCCRSKEASITGNGSTVIGNDADTNAIQLMKDRNARDQLFVRIAAMEPGEWVRMLREQADQDRKSIVYEPG